MKISCVIPTRDRRQMVCAAIESVLAQETPVAEIIVVDDGSLDDTSACLRKTFADVQVIRLRGQGPGPARNAGVAACRGDIIMFLDDDDTWLANHVGALRDVLAKGYEVAYGITRTQDRISGGEFFIPATAEAHQGDCFAALLNWCFLVPSAMAVSRRALLQVGGFSDSAGLIGEDWLLFLRLAAEFDFGFADCEITRRNLHAGSLCSQVDGAGICRTLKMLADNLSVPDNPAQNSIIYKRFRMLEQWVADNGAHWTSVQDWYLAMQEGGMI